MLSVRGLLRNLFFIFFILACSSHSARALELFYKYKSGDRYRFISTVNQDIYVDRKLSFKAEILNRMIMEVKEVTSDGGLLFASFQSAEKTSPIAGEKAPANIFQWSKDYDAEFYQDRLGYMKVDDKYYRPMLRNVPVFPGRALVPGETWSAVGMEVHDFRDSFGIEEPYRIPLTADYTYLGELTYKENTYPAFSVSYRLFIETDPVAGKVYPKRIQAASNQIIYWDIDRGQVAAYEEHFRTIFDLSDGQTWEYRGRAEAEVVEAPPMDKDEMAKEITEEISGLSDVSVRVSDEGIVISLENIQFAPDSAVLMRSELPKLDLIAEILAKYPDRDILVGGHTALAGTAAGRLQLSQERAASVANYFIGRNVRTADRVVIRGYGSERPIADNRTVEGMARNRRVEITILEN